MLILVSWRGKGRKIIVLKTLVCSTASTVWHSIQFSKMDLLSALGTIMVRTAWWLWQNQFQITLSLQLVLCCARHIGFKLLVFSPLHFLPHLGPQLWYTPEAVFNVWKNFLWHAAFDTVLYLWCTLQQDRSHNNFSACRRCIWRCGHKWKRELLYRYRIKTQQLRLNKNREVLYTPISKSFIGEMIILGKNVF